MSSVSEKLPHEKKREPVKRLAPDQSIYGMRVDLKGEFRGEGWLQYIDNNIKRIGALVKKHWFVQLHAKQIAWSQLSGAALSRIKNNEKDTNVEEWHSLSGLGRTILCDPLELLRMSARHFLGNVEVPEGAPGRRKLSRRVDAKRLKQEQFTQRDSLLQTYVAQRYEEGHALFFGNAVAHASEKEWRDPQKILSGHIHPKYDVIGIICCRSEEGLKKLRKCWYPTDYDIFCDDMTGKLTEFITPENERTKYYFWKTNARSRNAIERSG